MILARYLVRAIFFLLASVVPVVILARYPNANVAALFDGPRIAAWISCLVGMIGLFLLAGITIRGRVLGVLIDERNRYSLSRLQITLWTILVLASLYTVFMANVVRGDATNMLNINLDYNLPALMGISIASFVTAPVALSVKAAQSRSNTALQKTGQQLRAAQNLTENPVAVGKVIVKCTSNDARLADLIRGEDIANATIVDLLRLQMLVITIVVVIAYGAAVGHSLGIGSWVLAALPKLNETLLLLVLISHGGYVAGKLVPSTATQSDEASKLNARALQASQRAASLAIDLQAQLNTCVPGDPRYGWLRSSVALAQGTSADAASILGRVGLPDFNPDEVANVEGRIDALQANMHAQPAAAAGRQVLDAPSPDTVSKVQRRLYELGHNDVMVSGIVDGPTEQATREELARLGVDRTDLHPRPYRFFEELAQLIK